MIEYNKAKYHVGDSLYQSECERIISNIESAYTSGSFFALKKTYNSLSSLSLIIRKNNEDRDRYYLPNLRHYNQLKEWISWDLVEPLSEFESKVKPLMEQASDLLEKNDYSENRKASEVLDETEEILKKYIKDTKLIDSGVRNQVHNRINCLKTALSSCTFFSLMISEKTVNEINMLLDMNSRQYEKSFIRILKKAQIVHSAFEKYKEFFRINDSNDVLKQFSEIDEIMKSQSYEKFEDALDILDVIELKIDEVRTDKKTNIINSIISELQNLRTKIWLEDWENLKYAADQLIKEAEEKGFYDKLNLDKFNTVKMISDKKNGIFTFIKNIGTKNYSNQTALVKAAENMLKNEAYKADLESLTGRKDPLKKTDPEKKERLSENKKKLIKFTAAVILIALSIVIFSVNQVKNAEHFNKKGEKYAVFAEALVYTSLRSGKEIDAEKIRARMGAPEKDLQIIELNDKEVVIRYKGTTYRKKVRPVK
ncbi:MAG: hypothetical protein JXN63_08100 [Candidatus Delongbacteria bacterium]|nr:hypothetical protein [Candidatus Delongbacteria bacterium]